MPNRNEPSRTPVSPDGPEGDALEELEKRLEAQRVPVAADASVACYSDYCPEDCLVYCGSGYSGCTDLCGCDGTQCLAECLSLCVADSCVVDII